MKKLQILINQSPCAVKRCGTTVLYLYAPNITGDTPAAQHMAAIIRALTAYATTTLAEAAEQALRKAVSCGQLLHFTPHTVKITLKITEEKAALCLALSLLRQGGDGVQQSEVLYTYWSHDQRLQYRRAPKRLSLFSHAALRGRAKCAKI